MIIEMPLKVTPFTCRTDGKGLWSATVAETKIVSVTAIHHVYAENPWDDDTESSYTDFKVQVEGWGLGNGLIYGDDLWILDFVENMEKQGFIIKYMNFTEQGMQGDVAADGRCMVSVEGIMFAGEAVTK